MRRLPAPLRLDFVAPVHRAPRAGAVLLAAGLAAAAGVGLAFQRQVAERERLEAALGAVARPRRAPPGPEAVRAAAEVAGIEHELEVPWTRLLAELEAASHDSLATVALLRVEPDPAKRLVRITAEVRALPDAVAFLERLQKSPVLRNAVLESHERRKDDRGHPVRVQLSAEWRT